MQRLSVPRLALLSARVPVGFNQCPSSLQVILEAAVDFYSAAWGSPHSLRNSPPDICTCSDCFFEAEFESLVALTKTVLQNRIWLHRLSWQKLF